MSMIVVEQKEKETTSFAYTIYKYLLTYAAK